MKNKLLVLLSCLFLGMGTALAQTSVVSGVVVSDKDGEPVIGASVFVEGTTIGAISDIDGKFTINNVPASAKTLMVSYIGMKTQVIAIKKGNITIALESDTEQLDEVMVVAFGTQKKSAFTGAAAVVDSKELSKHVSTNVANALAGSVPGLQLRGTSGAPGAGAGSIKIRGIASLYAATDPLIIVDGAPYSASLTNIPQDEIESVTVLKDAASAALYGARGAAGVILITTKAGKLSKAQVNVDMKWGVNSRSVQDYRTVEDPAKYLETVYGAYENYYVNAGGYDAAKANVSANALMNKHLGYSIYTVPKGEQLIGMDGKLNPGASKGYSYVNGDETYYMTNDDYRQAAYSNALRQEYNINVNGAHEHGTFFASASYLNEDGIIDYSGYERFSARFKADYKVKKWLKVGANVSYTNSKTTSTSNMGTAFNETNLMYFTSLIAPIYPVYVRVIGPDGKPMIRTDKNGNPQYDYGKPGNSFPEHTRTFIQGNPLGANRYNDTVSKGQKFNGTFTVDVKITDWLKFNANSMIDWGHTNGSWYNTALYGPKVSVNGTITKSQTDSRRQNHVQTLTFNKSFSGHELTVLAGHEYYDTRTTYLSADAQGLFTPEIQEINASAKPVTSSSYNTRYNVEGYFGNAQYNYKEKYFASASYRRDASSRFAKKNRWGNFWSVGAAWLINKESFFHAKAVDQLKLKLSYGQQGNDNIGDNYFVDMYNLVKVSDVQMAPTFARIGNPDITWETTANLNAGLEFALFKYRLTGSVDFYHKKTTDLLFSLSVPEENGSRAYYGNVGDIRNTGVEFSIQGSVIRTKNVDWALSFNISHNSDKILKLPKDKVAELGGFTESSRWYKEGGSIYNPFQVKYAGLNENGEATYWVDKSMGGRRDYPAKNLDERTTNPNSASRYELGSILPKAYGGFGTTLSIYGFDVSMNFDYQLGGKVYDNSYATLMSGISSARNAGRAIHVDMLKAWSPTNSGSNIPRFQYGDQYTASTSDRFYTSARYLNFQSFAVGYTIPQKFLARTGLSKVRIYATGENLYFWSARKGLDPRYSYTGNASVAVYSPVRTIMGGIQLTF